MKHLQASKQTGVDAPCERAPRCSRTDADSPRYLAPRDGGRAQLGDPGDIHIRVGPSDACSARLRPSQSGPHPPANQFALELCDRRDDAEDEPAVPGARVDSLMQADKMYAERVEFDQRVHELEQGARETVVTIDEDGVEIGVAWRLRVDS
jgi:hypothetical protein